MRSSEGLFAARLSKELGQQFIVEDAAGTDRAGTAEPGSLRYSSTGTATNIHLAGVLFEQMASIPMRHVPCKEQAPAVVDLLASHIQLTFSGSSTMLPRIQAGKLRALAVTTATRSPELPSVTEFLPGYVSDFWTAMHAPEGLARIIAREQAIRTKVVRQAGIRVDP